MSDDIQTAADAGLSVNLPQITLEQLEGVLGAISSGRNPEAELDAVHQSIIQQIIDQGGDPGAADAAASAFTSTLQEELFNGGQTLTSAADYAQRSMGRTFETYDPSTSQLSATDALFNAIASGEGIEEAVARAVREMSEQTGSDDNTLAVEQAFLDELQASLSRGESPDQAMANASNVAQSTSDALADATVPVENPILQALAGGGDVDGAINDAIQQSGGDADAFVDQLEASLAGGEDADDALNTAGQTANDVAQARSDAEVELSAADRLAQALANGDNVAEQLAEAGGGEAFANALEDALAGGTDAGAAMQQADQAQQQEQQTAEQQSVPLSAADQLAASLASGQDVDQAIENAGGGDAFGDEMINQLASGADAGDAMQQAQAAQQTADSTAEQQSVPLSAADQLAASLASGENVDQAMQDAGVGDAGGDEMMNQLASGADAGEAMQEAAATQQSADATAEQQSVPADAAVQALAQGGDAVNDVDVSGAIADATGEVNPPSNEAAQQTQTAEAGGESTDGGETQAAPQQQAAAEQSGESETQQQTAGGGSEESGQTQEPQQTAAAEPEQTGGTQEAEQSTSAEAEPATTTETEQAEQTQEPQQQTAAESETETETETQTAQSTEEANQAPGGEETTEDVAQDGPTEEGVTEEIQTASTGQSEEGQQGDAENGQPAQGQGEQQNPGGLTDAEIDALDDVATAAGGNAGGGNTGPSGPAPNFQNSLNPGPFGNTGSTTPTGGTGSGGATRPARDTSSRDNDTTTGGAGDDDIFINTAPTASADSGAGHENETLTINVLANDSDPDGDSLTISSATVEAGKGTVAISGGTIEFDPGADFDDLDDGDTEDVTITYTVSDGAGGSASSTVLVTVTGTNDAPVAVIDADNVTENGSVLVDVLANDTDVDGDDNPTNFTLTNVSVPAGQGSVSIEGNQVRFNPGADFESLDVGDTQVVAITYTMQDDSGAVSTGTLNMSVNGTNDGPVAVADTAGGTENQELTIDVLANDTDIDGDDSPANFTVTNASVPAGQGSVTIVGNQVVFKPGTDFDDLDAGDTATVTISYDMQDDSGAASSSTVTVTVTGTNDAPVAVADTGGVGENGTLLVDVLANDTDVDGDDNPANFTLTNVSVPAGQGSVSIEGNQVRFNPGTDFEALDDGDTQVVTVTYTMQDDSGATATGSLDITVSGANDTPTLSVGSGDSDTGTVNETDATNLTTAGTLSVEDVDPSDTVSVSVTGVSASGLTADVPIPNFILQSMMTVDAGDVIGAGETTGTVNWSFDSGLEAFDFVGEGQTLNIAYTIEVSDGTTSSTRTVTVSVTGSNDAHIVTGDIDAGSFTDNAGTQTIDLFQNVLDIDDNAAPTVENLVASNSNGDRALVEGTHYSINANTGALRIFTSAFDDLDTGDPSETLTFTYNVSDGLGNSIPTEAQVTITAINDTPTVSASTSSTVTSENFEGVADGWSDPTTSDLGTYSSALGTFAQGGATEKTFSIPDGSGGTTITFDFYRMDTWDGETFTVSINGTPHETVSFNGGLFVAQGDSVGSFVALDDGSTNVNNRHGPDQAFRTTITLSAAEIAALPLNDTGGRDLTLGFSSTLNQDASDESWAVDNLSITATDVPLGSGSENTEIAVIGISVGDNDGENLTVTLTANDNATVTANQNGGGAYIVGDGSGVMVISGSAADINTALNTLSYAGDTNFVGLGSIDVDVFDGTATRSTSVAVNVAEGDDAPTLSTDASGGNVLDVNGANSYVDLPREVINGRSEGTIETWVFLDGNTNETIFSNQAHGQNSTALLQVGQFGGVERPDGQLTWRPYNGNTELSSTTTLQTGQWYHVAVTFSGSTGTLYVNGVAEDTAAGNFSIPTLTYPHGGGATIGSMHSEGSGGYALDGQLAEFRIWDTIRTPTEIADNMNATLVGDEAGLRALYNFSDDFTSGDAVADATGTYNGTAVNTATVVANDHPVASSGPAGDEDTPIAVQNIVVGDIDSSDLTVTLDGPSGSILTALNSGGATVTGSGGDSITIAGPVADVNAALQTLAIQPPANFNGTAQISVAVTDGTSIVSDTVDVTVNPVDDPVVFNQTADRSIDFQGLGTNGNDSSFSFGIAENLDEMPTSAMTLEMDVRTTDTDFALFGYSTSSASDGNQLVLFHDPDGNHRLVMNGSTVINDLNLGINDGEWHHIAIAFDNGAGTGSVYVDGVQIDTFTPNGALTAGGILTIGNEQDSLGGTYREVDALTGSVDNVRIWDVARTAQEIADNAGNLVDSANEPNLVIDWRMDEDSDTIVNSANPDGPALTLNNATTESDSTTIVANEDFEGAVSGWSAGSAVSSNVTNVLGPFANGNNTTEKTFTLSSSASEANLTFDVHFNDTWDGETFTLTANGEVVAQRSYPSAGTTIGTFTQTSTADTGVAGTAGYGDGTFQVEVALSTAQLDALPTDGNGNKLLTLNFSSTLDQGATDESWSIDNLVIESDGGNVEVFSTEADAIAVDLLDGVSGGEGDIDVANLTITASDDRTVNYTLDAETGSLSIDMSQFEDLNADGSSISLTVSYEATDGLSSAPISTVYQVNGSQAPELLGSIGNQHVLTLDGTDDFIEVDHSASLNMSGNDPLTISMWINPDAKSGLQTLIDKSDSDAFDAPSFRLHYIDGQITSWNPNGGEIHTLGTPVPTGQWSHVSLVYDGTNVSILVNGVEQTIANGDESVTGTSIAYSFGAANTDPMLIGYDKFDGRQFDGQMAGIEVWSEARSADQIADSMTSGIANPAGEANLAAYYTFEDGGVSDSSANNNHGTFLNGATVETINETGVTLGQLDFTTGEGVALTGTLLGESPAGNAVEFAKDGDPANGTLAVSSDGSYTYTPSAGFAGSDSFRVKVTDTTTNASRIETVTVTVNDPPVVADHSNALSLDGSSHAVIASDAALDVTTTFTLEMWVKADGAGTLISKDGSGGVDTSGAYNMAVYTGSDGKLSLEYETNNSGPSLTVSDSMDVGAWHHVAATFDNGNLKLYVDGTEVGSQTGVPAPSVLNTDLLIGRRGFDPDPRYLSGEVDEIRIWDTALDQTALQSNMNKELNGDESGLAGYWSFNEDTGNAVDQTGNGNDATLQGNAGRSNMVEVSISNNDIYKGLLLGKDANSDSLSYSIKEGPDHGSVSLDGNKFVYDHVGDGQSDSFTVEISDGTDTVTEQIDITVV